MNLGSVTRLKLGGLILISRYPSASNIIEKVPRKHTPSSLRLN
uniref:Uncharacterized protein n=1 Tax=Rhizophora mucronata TaxID=61149 RepID=A0A2P2IXT3_RHIMU